MIASDSIEVPLLVNGTRNWLIHEGGYAEKENRIGRGKYVQKIGKQKREKEKEKDGAGNLVKATVARRDLNSKKEEKDQNDDRVDKDEERGGEIARVAGTRKGGRGSKRACVIIRCERCLSIRAPTAK